MRDILSEMNRMPKQQASWNKTTVAKTNVSSFYNYFECQCCGLRTDWITHAHAQGHGYADRNAMIEAGKIFHNGKPYRDNGRTKAQAGRSKTKTKKPL